MENKKKTILIVEDHQSVVSAMKLLLGEKYNLVIFNTADEAVDEIKNIGSNDKPDLIITDNNTKSNLRGLDVLAAAKAAGIKAIMHSGSPEIEQDVKRLYPGVPFVLKSSGNLTEAVDNIFGQQPDIRNKPVIRR